MYHDLLGLDHDTKASGPDVYSVTLEDFHEHLESIDRSVASPPQRGDSLSDVATPWMLTFDDGGVSGLAAGQELARRGWPGHFFIVTDVVGHPGYMDWDQIRALAKMGHVIGSHSCSHPDRMAACTYAQLLDEWSRSAAVLEEELGRQVPTASVPGGLYSKAVGRAAAAAGYRTLFTSLPSQKVGSIDGCMLIGRFGIRRDTTATLAAAAAAGRPVPWIRQRAAWTLRGAAKALTGRHYDTMRRAVLWHRG
jgi:peptidoglycan/xylan/chitin deacetylase (PgdA/CDA1 family)